MNKPALDPRLTRDETTQVVEGLVTGWTIPEEVPQGLSTAIVPNSECPEGAQFTARTLHTLVLRSRPRTLVVLSSEDIEKPELVAMGQIQTALGASSVDERLAARIASELGTSLEIVSGDSKNILSLQRMVPLLCQVLAPGCRFVPIILPRESTHEFTPEKLGAKLGSILQTEQGACLIAGFQLPKREKLGSSDSVSDDASIIRHILEPDTKSLMTSSMLVNIQDFSPVVVAVEHSQKRHAQRGFLLEHGSVGKQDQQRGAASLVL
ncbi:MAG: hypothetical protein P8K66_02625 [Planctomycetota bacterium]|nr:hypothetical protein [Planctomycetota bacterium]